jgi:hypothetical protein
MPTYTIELPDGRKMQAEAGSEAEALAGAQSWYAENSKREPLYGYESAIPTAEQQIMPDISMPDLAEQVGQGFLLNYGDEVAATAGALPNWLTGGRYGKPRQQILDEIRERDKRFETEHPREARVGEIGGALGAGVTTGGIGAARLLGQAPGLFRAAGAGAVSAAPLGAVDATGKIEGPAGIAEYADKALRGGLTAGAIGGAAGGIGNAVARVLGPWATAAAQRLSDRGIRLTPGELMGGGAKRVEETTGDLPFTGYMLRDRMDEGIADLNRTAINDAMLPLEGHFPQIHRQYGRADVPGRDMIGNAHQMAADALDDIVPRMRGQLDNTLAQDIDAITHSLPQSERPEFTRMVMEYLARADRHGTGDIRGRSMQDVIGSMRDLADGWAKSAQPGTFSRELSEAYRGVKTALEMNLERHTLPEVLEAYQAANHTYRNLITVETAAGSLGTEGGVFTPAQLLNAVKSTDRSVRRNRFSRGEAGDLQDLAEDAKTVMGKRVPNSGTAERYFMQNLPYAVGAAAAGTGNPYVLAGIPALLSMHTRPVHRAFQAAGTFSPHTRAAVRRAIERATGAGAPAAGLLAGRE